MMLSIWFWIFIVLWIALGFWRFRGEANPYPFAGNHVLQLILFLILGWQVFGSPVR